MTRLRRGFQAGLGAATLALAGAPAHATTFKADYAVTLAGFAIATADLVSTIEGTSYKTQFQARTTGLAGVFASGKGGAVASGSLAGGRPVPAQFALTSRTASSQVAVTMALAQGNVAQVDIVPPLEPKPDRVPLGEGHKRGVVDPVSAVLMPVQTKGGPTDPANCNRTIPVFDGAGRYDLVLSFAETRQAEVPGYRGPVLVCKIRYVPLAGHRSERPGTKFMMQNEDMSVWLAPIAGTRALAPLRIAIRTMLGMSVAEATRFGVEDGPATASAAPPGRPTRRN
jgi:hypothetical protein